jgi:hypothetical protein
MDAGDLNFFAIAGVDVPPAWDEVMVRLDPATPSSGAPAQPEGN